MSRGFYKWDTKTKQLVQLGGYQDTPRDAAAPYIIDDTMPLTENHADGNWYDSKSEYRKAVRRAGCIEIGNEKLTQKPLQRPNCITRNDMQDAFYKAARMTGWIRD